MSPAVLATCLNKGIALFEMNFWYLLLAAAGAFFASAYLTGVLRRYALRAHLLDVPNARSSHSQPTPRGGGLAIVLTFLVGVLGAWYANSTSDELLLSLLGGGLMVAGVGYIDDHRGVAAPLRLIVHLLAATWALVWIGGVPPLPVLGLQLELGWTGMVIGVLFAVWLLNLYNFMDGIDGIAGVEAVTVGAGAAAIMVARGDLGGALTALLIAAAAAGFLFWNWPPAKIFMGDVGSGFLGFILATTAFTTSVDGAINFWAWLILLGVFIVDATVTLLRRVWQGERFYEAHRSHAYQRAARLVGSHLRVTLVVGAVNLLWLLPIAWWASVYPAAGAALLCLAWLPLLGGVLLLGAGRPGDIGERKTMPVSRP